MFIVCTYTHTLFQVFYVCVYIYICPHNISDHITDISLYTHLFQLRFTALPGQTDTVPGSPRPGGRRDPGAAVGQFVFVATLLFFKRAAAVTITT